jgi:hypothetical protein
MATKEELNPLLARRRAAAEARKAAAAAPVETKPVVDLEPNADEALIEERRKAQALQDATVTATSMTESATKNSRAVARPMRDLSREMSTNDVVMPKLKLSQAMSKVNTDDTVRQGNWYVSTTSQNLGQEVYVVPVDMRMSYSKFEQGVGVVCRSFDLLHGEGDPGILCEGTQDEIDAGVPANERGCPFRLWTKDEATGKSVPPKCGKNYNYPVLILDPNDLENGRPQPALLSLRSTAAQTAKLINSIVTGGILTDPVWHETILKIGVDRKTNTRGTFFVPTVEYAGETGGSVEKAAAAYAERMQRDATIYRRSMENDDTE